MRNLSIRRSLLLTAMAAGTLPAAATTGSLDPTFNSSGIATANYGGTETANAVAVMPNGKIVVAGSSNTLGNSDIAVIRYNANGTLDTTFDSDGGVLTDFASGSDDFATAVAVQPDGKILVAGYTGSGIDNEFFVIRYNADGSLDNFFGRGGKASDNDGDSGDDDRATSIAIQDDGKIIVAGNDDIANSCNFQIFRYNTDGSLDTTFGSGGIVNQTFGNEDICNAIAIQTDGNILLAGYTNNPGTNDFAILRLTTTGSPDTSFDSDGKVTAAFVSDDRASSVVIQPDGKIVVAGSSNSGTSDMAIARFSTSGAPDTSFSGDGKQTVNFSGLSVEFCNALVLQSDGKFILGGKTTQSDPLNDFAFARLTSNGEQDATFGTAGTLAIDVSIGGADIVNAMALQKDGRVLAAGSSLTDFALTRLDVIAKTDLRIGTKSTAPAGNNIYNATGANQTLSVNVNKSGGKKNVFVRIENDGQASDSFKVKGNGGNVKFAVSYFNGTTNVTSAVTSGTFSTGNLAPGKSLILKVQITAKTSSPKKKMVLAVTGTSGNDTTSKDTVKIAATSK